MKKSTQIIVSFALALTALGLWALKSDDGKTAEKFFGSNSSPTPSLMLREGEKSKEIEIADERYENGDYGFSIKIPEGAETVNGQEEGYAVLIRGGGYEMQIYITPFDEDIALTADRVRRDIPDIKMKGEKAVIVGETEGIAFVDEDSNTREIWFVKGENLYQISASPQFDAATAEILQSWKWES